jgi:hypothetical protein
MNQKVTMPGAMQPLICRWANPPKSAGGADAGGGGLAAGALGAAAGAGAAKEP